VTQITENLFSKSANENRPLILDGAMGSLFQKKGYIPDSNIWMTRLNCIASDTVIIFHKSYIDAGADIISTNTFRTNPSALSTVGIKDSAPYVREAVNLAKEAIKEFPVYLAGSNAPAEDCYQEDRTLTYNQLESNHKIHIDLLIENDVEFILNETQSHFDEIKIVCRHCYSNRIPYVVSIYFDENLKILSGESIELVLAYIWEHEPLAVGFNCIAPELFEMLTNKVDINFNWGFYLNCFGGSFFKEGINTIIDSTKYLKIVKNSLKYEPSFIGACCGSTPEHIEKIKKFLNGKNN
jgi:homocysteine S-methyltransferase